MCEINLVANRLNHKKLASNMACYAISYLKNIYCVSVYKYYFDLLESIEKHSKVDQDIINSEIKKLRKTRYQSKFKRGHFYQFNYTVSMIILSVLETYSDQEYTKYRYADFKNFLTYPVCRHTVTVNLPDGTLKLLEKGEVIDLSLLDKKLKQIKDKEIYMDQYCG